jgi:hypothetical protein
MRTSLILLAAMIPLAGGCARGVGPNGGEPESPARASDEAFPPATPAVNTSPPAVPTPPVSLRWVVWTNFIAHTNGRSIDLFATNIYVGRGLPRILRWNTNSLIYGAEGFTAFTTESGYSGQYPGTMQGTLLTRRHAVFRGHGWMEGSSGIIRTNVATSFFLTASNTTVAARSLASLGRLETVDGVRYDYAIILFDADVPDSITPVDAVLFDDYVVKYRDSTNPSPRLTIQLCQHYKTTVDGDGPAFAHNAYVGGDSGAANLLPLPSAQGRPFRLAYISGRSTTGVTPRMLADIDRLSAWAGLSTNRYRPKLVDLSRYY